MRVDRVSVPELPDVSGVEQKRVQLQVQLLKKVLESQQRESEELMKMADGRGQVIDLRV
ncbi:MAG TPA: hypothetical protein PKA27_13815 [Fimbriimonadaceae bacterium]|nr:hypothetical protein [Fimbriimonadaceae bacterium]